MKFSTTFCGLAVLVLVSASFGQPPQERGGQERGGQERGGRDRGGPPGFGIFGGPGGMFGRGPGGPNRSETKLLEEFDKDESGWLDKDERALARKKAKSSSGGRRGGFGPPGGRRGGSGEPNKPGKNIKASEVKNHPNAKLYDSSVLRTLFLEFENKDWEKELEDFRYTDVHVAATLKVDGKTYKNVGIRFRGQSSYDHYTTGNKRSFNLKMDLADKDQRLYGYKTLNLLNSAGDPSFMSTILYSHVANQYLPAPKANHVRVVINGENWGIYVNVQQFNKDFLREHFESTKGTRWKVAGSPQADGGLRYLGDDLEQYKQRFEMKSNDGKKAWNALVNLCKVLNETPLENLEKELEPLLDIDRTLRFLALDVALVNSDGYWTRASDYSIFLDKDKKFHIIPHDMNEAFHSGGRGPGGPGGRGRGPGGRDRGGRGFGGRERGGRERGGRGFGGPGRERGSAPPQGRDDRRPDSRGGRGPGGQGPDGPRILGFPVPFGGPGRGGPGGPGGPGGHGSVELDPLVSIENQRMPLRSRLLAIPKLREKYLGYVREIAEKSLDWKKLEPVIARHKKLIAKDVVDDTRKLTTSEAFQQATSLKPISGEGESLRKFIEQRRKFLLEYKTPEMKKASASAGLAR